MADPIGTNTGQRANLIPLGFQQISNPSTPTNLSPPAGATLAQIEIESLLTTGHARYRDDGSSPSSTVGALREAGQEFSYAGDLEAIQFINVSNSNPSTINVSYYR